MATKETQSERLARIEAHSGVRFDRIEEKLDKLGEAMISIARAEEKLATLNGNYDNQFQRMNRFSDKLDQIEKKVDDNANTVRVINRLFWIAVTTIAGALVASFWM